MTQTYGPFAAGAGASLGQDQFLDLLGPMLQSDGVNSTLIAGLGSSLQVYGNSSGMQVLMRAGSALLRGAMYSNTADVTLTIAASTTSPRIDRVVLRNDRGFAGGGKIYPFVITGTPASSPVAPAITQSVGGVWDMTLAQVTVPASAAGISPGNVSDERVYLPLRIPIASSNVNPLPVDGSQGRVYYDTSVGDLVVTNGSRWQSLTGFWNTDTGDQGLGLGSGFTGTATYRQVGRIVFLDGAVTATSSSAAVCAIPSAVCPVAAKNYAVLTNAESVNPVSSPYGGGTYTISVWPAWNLAVPSRAAAIGGTPLTLSIQDGRDPTGTSFEWHVSYPV